jgi:hypothetical protein
VRTRDILLELGRRGVIGGQEDMIVEVAAELAARVRQDSVSPTMHPRADDAVAVSQ